ncbi:conserved hypothetical protein [metagenome]|uniref:N-acetyltransferase domain-containing protein n=1 Tax=metagenome TaxID=256318 RepID=A0A2P2C1B7_9ZZZZ
MSDRSLLDELIEQEQRLVFESFDEEDAWRLGVALREAALARDLPVAISVRRNGQRLFHAALPGASADNDGWLERKCAVVDRYGQSSLQVGERFRVGGGAFDTDSRLDPQHYAAHGGAFPILVRDTGCIGTVAVSGLPQLEDHRLVVGVLEALLAADADGSPYPANLSAVRVELHDIRSPEDWARVMDLSRAPGQERYLNSMQDIREEAHEDRRAMPHPWSVRDAATGGLVGFAMISDNIPEPIDDDLVGPYFLWKLLIDEHHQGKGYGAATLDAVVAYVRTRPGAVVLPTSCSQGPGSPRGFYLSHGFVDTGRIMWGENVLSLNLVERSQTE